MPQLYRRQGDEFVANSVKTGDQLAPKVVKLASGGFLMVWTDASGLTDTSGAGIIGQRFDAAGTKVGGEFLVNTGIAGNQSLAAVTALASGGFVVSWSDGGNGNIEKAQIFDAAGSKLGAEFTFDFGSFPHAPYHLAGLSGGGFVAINNAGAGQVFELRRREGRGCLFDRRQFRCGCRGSARGRISGRQRPIWGSSVQLAVF